MQQLAGGGKVSLRRHVGALALNRLGNERGDVSLAQLSFQRVKIPERDGAVRQQRVEAAPELRRPVH